MNVFTLLACRKDVPAEPPVVEAASAVEAEVESVAELPEAVPVEVGISLEEASDWMGLYRELEGVLVAREYVFEEGPESEAEAREWLCTDPSETEICLGRAA